ncbi:MAG: T9SS type A sorting domain-containing protein [Bacteroidales bacterium]
MIKKVKIILAIIVIAIFANVNLATAQNMSRWIELNVQQGKNIKLDFIASTTNTPIRIVSGSTDTIVMATANWVNPIYSHPSYYADATTMKVYGDVLGFRCNFNSTYLTGIDATNNTLLTQLWCYANKITSLNVSGLTALEYLNCYNNSLSSLDVSGLTSLEVLNYAANNLSSMDFSGLTSLKELDCSNNSISSLNLSGLTALEVLDYSSNNIGFMDFSGLTSLKELDCSDNSISSLNISNLTSLEVLKCGSNYLTSLDVSGLNALVELQCSNNILNSLNVSGLTLLEKINCSENNLTALDASELTSLVELYCSGSSLTSLNVSGNTALQYLNCVDNNLTTLDVSGLTALVELQCYDNNLTTLDLSGGLAALLELNCYNNNLTSLDLSGLVELQRIRCNDNNLTSLDASELVSLWIFMCYNNNLTSLDISGASLLVSLGCNNNNLTSLDASGKTDLMSLHCENNNLTSLNIRGTTKKLTNISCYNNNLSTEAIDQIYCDLPTPIYGSGEFFPVYDASSSNLEIVKATNSQNAIDRNWKVLYACDKTVVPTTGTYECEFLIPATVVTNGATDITQTSATLNGTVDPGTDIITEKGFEWKLTSCGTYEDLISTSAENTFNASLTGLTAGTSYTFRAYVKVGEEKIYGEEKTFITASASANMSRWVELNVLQGQDVFLLLTAVAENTPIRIISGSTDTTIIFGTNSDYIKCNTDSDIIKVYGDIVRFECSNNGSRIIGIDASNNTLLTTLDCHLNFDLTYLNVSGLTSLEYLNCELNNLTSLDVSGLTSLEYLNCKLSNLTSLDVNGLTSLVFLDCSDNDFTCLDLSGLTSLAFLDCFNSNLTSIDVSGLTSLKELHCGFNKFTSLDLSGLISLEMLACGYNNLTSLDLTGLTSLEELYCNVNKLKYLNVKGLTSLKKMYCHDNSFSTQALDQMYCDLPTRPVDDTGLICPVFYDTSSNYSTVVATNSQNAIDRNWDVVDCYGIPVHTTGTYQCVPNASIKDFAEIKIYPNPVNEVLCIIADDNQINSIEIYDIYGRLVLNKTKLAATKSTVDVSHLTSGVYVLRLDTTKGTTELKFVKQ